jgi:hypothetical protein
VALAAAALVLYRIVNTVLGAALGGNAVSELSTPFGALLAAVLVLAYHGLLLRADQARKPAPDGEDAPAVDAASVAIPIESNDVVARRTLQLVGPPGSDLDAALAAARAALPDGVSLEEAST